MVCDRVTQLVHIPAEAVPLEGIRGSPRGETVAPVAVENRACRESCR